MGFARALISGGAGFIGTHVARHLLETGLAGGVVSLDIADPAEPVPGVSYVRHDVRRPVPPAVAEGCDAVFDFAAVHRTPGHPDHEYFETNIAAATNISSLCDTAGIRTVFFTSSISVYGPGEHAVDENSPVRPIHAYGRSKWLAEEIYRAWLARGQGRRLVIARPAVVFGRGENGNYTRLVRLMRRGLFVYPGRKDTRKACGYVKEFPLTLAFALERASPYYLYNFAYRDCPTSEEICRLLVAAAAVSPPIGVAPRFLMEGIAFGMEILDALGLRNGLNRERIRKLVNSTHVVPKRLIEDGYVYRFSLQSAFSDWIAGDPGLGVKPRAAPAGDGNALRREAPLEKAGSQLASRS